MTESIEIRDLRQQDWVWSHKALLFHPDVDGNTYKVYCGLSSYANNKTQEAFPSIATLAKRLHMGRNTVIRALAKLEELNFVKIEKKLGEHNLYLLLDIVGELPRVARKRKEPAVAGENWVKEVLEWAELRKGAKFVNYGKQIGSLGMMKRSAYNPDEIKRCFVLMEDDLFWKSRGFDFTNVANELPKRISQIRKSGTGVYAHLTEKATS